MTAASADSKEKRPTIDPVLPNNGLVYSEKTTASEVLCKPKLIPIPPQSFKRDAQRSS